MSVVFAQHLEDLQTAEKIILSFHTIAVGVLGTEVSAFPGGHLPQYIIRCAAGNIGVFFLSCPLVGFRIGHKEKRIVIQHLLKMGTEPFLIRGIPGESTADMIEQTAAGHGVQRLFHHVHGIGSRMALTVLHQEQQMMGCGELGCGAESSPLGTEVFLQHLISLVQQFRTGLSLPGSGHSVEIVHDFVSVFRQLFRRRLPHGCNLIENIQQTDPGIGAVFREIGAGINGKLIR